MRMYCGNHPEGKGRDLSIWSRISSDGINWRQEPGVRLQGASMPSALILPDGRIRVYYCGFGPDGRMAIMSAFSTNGLDFVPEPGIRLDRGPPGSLDQDNVASPEVTALPGGGYRMYYRGEINRPYKAFWVPPHARQTQVILSARSGDGMNWERESGIRIDSRNRVLLGMADGPSIIETDSGWRLYYWSHMGIFKADSSDGLNFKAEKFPVLPGSGKGSTPSDPCLVMLPGNFLIMYFGLYDRGIYAATPQPRHPQVR